MRLVCLLLMSAVLSLATQAYAQAAASSSETRSEPNTSQIAREAFWKGKAHYDAGELSEAIDQFKRAYDLTGDPDLLYDIAQSHRKAGECSLALDNYRAFLRLSPQSSLAARAERQLAALQVTCETQVGGAPPADYVEQPIVEPTPAVVPATATAPNQAPPAADPHSFSVSEERSRGGALQAGALIALAGAAITGGLALGLEIWNENRHDEWRARDHNLEKGNAAGETDATWAVRQSANDEFGRSIERVDRTATYLSIGAGALLATSAVLYLWWPTMAPVTAPTGEHGAVRSHAHRGGRARSSIGVRPQQSGLAIIGTF